MNSLRHLLLCERKRSRPCCGEFVFCLFGFETFTCLDLLLGVDQVELLLRTLLLSLCRLQLRLRLPEALLEAKGVRPFGQFQQAAGGAATAGVPPAATAGAGADFQSIILEMLRQQNQTTMEMLRQQSLTRQQNQQMCAAMLRHMDLEEKRRNEADEKAADSPNCS